MSIGGKIVLVLLIFLSVQAGVFWFSVQRKYPTSTHTEWIAATESRTSSGHHEAAIAVTDSTPGNADSTHRTSTSNNENNQTIVCPETVDHLVPPSFLGKYPNSTSAPIANSTTIPFPSSPSRTWKSGTFCHEFLAKTFQLKAPVCSAHHHRHASCGLREAVECYGSPYSGSMGSCLLRNAAVFPGTLMRVMYDPDRPKFEANPGSVVLLEGEGTACDGMSIDSAARRMEAGDYVLKVVKSISDERGGSNRRHRQWNATVCRRWINETTLFFTAHRFHIYFRFLDYYNVHKLLEDAKSSGLVTLESAGAERGEAIKKTKKIRIIRISGSDNYHFPEFDGALFPEARVQALEDLQNVTTCFREVVLVPKSYASPLFQCKSRNSLVKKCKDCDGRGLNETDISRFSRRVVKTCSSKIDHDAIISSMGDGKKLIVLVSRKPYLRNQNDKINHFERVLENEEELREGLERAFANVSVRVLHLENLSICEQIAYGERADVFLGVHGSGLVHLWWMREEGLLFEMEPMYQLGNPTFRTLALLSGRRYHKESVSGGFRKVHAHVESVVSEIRKHFKTS